MILKITGIKMRKKILTEIWKSDSKDKRSLMDLKKEVQNRRNKENNEKAAAKPQEALKRNTKNPLAPEIKAKPMQPPKTEQTQTPQEKRKAAIGNTLKSLGFKDNEIDDLMSKGLSTLSGK